MHPSKEHIILVASGLFLQKSFKEVTMKEIVDKTGLSKGAFYHYFKSKEQLFQEVVEYFFLAVIHEYGKYSKDSLRQFYHDYITETVRMSSGYIGKFDRRMGENFITMNYFTMMFDALKLLPEFRERAIEGFNEELDHWTAAIARARQNGEIASSMSDREIAETFMYLSDGVGMHMVMRGADVEGMMQPLERLWDSFYEQIKA